MSYADTPATGPVPPQDLSGIVGRRLIYTYANGWQYEMYVKNDHTIDYRIHSGPVGGRWVKGQNVDLVMLTPGVYKVSWNEPTGTSVVVNIIPEQRVVHGVIFFPDWVKNNGARTVVFQNDHLDEMRAYRDAGPTYPIHVVAEFATITFVEHVGEDNEQVISVAPAKQPVE
ncbi:phenolic acid decarboxylase [Micromonospora sp. NPDC050397]|uniref:phenolic acid decarboxylase n=1 Tax=Micromonospora sp. NPDC050397 TaxID=3364279 RepID=UPI00384C4D0E